VVYHKGTNTYSSRFTTADKTCYYEYFGTYSLSRRSNAFPTDGLYNYTTSSDLVHDDPNCAQYASLPDPASCGFLSNPPYDDPTFIAPSTCYLAFDVSLYVNVAPCSAFKLYAPGPAAPYDISGPLFTITGHDNSASLLVTIKFKSCGTYTSQQLADSLRNAISAYLTAFKITVPSISVTVNCNSGSAEVLFQGDSAIRAAKALDGLHGGNMWKDAAFAMQCSSCKQLIISADQYQPGNGGNVGNDKEVSVPSFSTSLGCSFILSAP
jgi:hypothetical protein